jgi:hypothetical protein
LWSARSRAESDAKESDFPEATELREEFLEQGAKIRQERAQTLLERSQNQNRARLQVEYSPFTVHLRFKSRSDLELDRVSLALDGIPVIESRLPVNSTRDDPIGWESFYSPRVPVGPRFLSVRIEARKHSWFAPFRTRASRLVYEDSIPVFVNPESGQIKFVAELSDASLVDARARLHLVQVVSDKAESKTPNATAKKASP